MTSKAERKEAEKAALDAARDIVLHRHRGRCERCSGPGSEFSHRRTRAVKGEHQHCPCNAEFACRACHAWMHSNPEQARLEGHHVSRYVDEPGSVPVWLRGQWRALHCDGTVTLTDAPS